MFFSSSIICTNEALIIPVGTATTPTPIKDINVPNILPQKVRGYICSKPTPVNEDTAHQKDSVMLEKISGLRVDRTLSPDECVAHGAAIYADILLKYGEDAGSGISIKNVNSHDLGVLGTDSKTKTKKRKMDCSHK